MPDAIVQLAPRDPDSLLMMAVEKGATIETIERLLAAREKWQLMRAREAWFQAMAAFHKACPPIKKTKTATVPTSRGQFTYSYAPLEQILETVGPVMADVGLTTSWACRIEPNRVVAACNIAHVLGHVESSGEIAILVDTNDGGRGSNPAQRVGSALSYAKRYTILSIIGLAPESSDDDGQAAGQGGGGGSPRRSRPDNPPPAGAGEAGEAPPALTHWREQYEACTTAEAYLAAERQLEPYWSRYTKAQQGFLRELRKRIADQLHLTPEGPAAGVGTPTPAAPPAGA